MKLSILWLLAENEELNERTRSCLANETAAMTGTAEIFLYVEEVDEIDRTAYEEKLSHCELIWCERGGRSDVVCYNDAAERISGELVTAVAGGDIFSEGALAMLEELRENYPEESILMARKEMPDGKEAPFGRGAKNGPVEVIHLEKDYTHYPFYFGGTFVRTDYYRKHAFRPELGLEAEREYFLSLCMDKMRYLLCRPITYRSEEAREGDNTFFRGVYERDWYEKSIDEFWIPFLEKCREKRGKIPYFIQYHLMFTIRCRITANWNNRNKHVITEGREEEVLRSFGRVFQLLDTFVIYNGHKVRDCLISDTLKWVYGILKYGEGYHFQKGYLAGKPYYGAENIFFNKIDNLKTNIVFMNYEDRVLHVDGTLHPILFSMAEEVYFLFNEEKIPLVYNERYSIDKVFGVSISKRQSFHVNLPMEGIEEASLFCVAVVEGEEIRIPFSYASHFSRMSGAYKNSYWCFGTEPMYLTLKNQGGLSFSVSSAREKRAQERKLSREMLRRRTRRSLIFFAIRKAYFALKPFMKRKPIWMYQDKIYKGGDSSEYLFRYAVAQNDGIQHYYLVDKKATDYRRLKKDGYKPLVRRSIKHRLVFLMADMMVISNSTVFAFNDYGLPNSSEVRDLINFHVCCVQHGMSVQKIAIAQNRLRDNIRLYFCASKYEIENLSRPVYDYVGYDALKLTGVPRYDGLVNDDKKQIMISPTWRMQAAVPVRTNEGEQRDYNPLFRESTYFKVFNSLINDPRLIEAAEKYGYRIKYVLHPIVSAQVDDFDKNEHVDIIPAVGDMSYERMFCESSLMVTDFSGIQFDFAYMRKPLIYLHHRDIPQHYEEGTFFYDTMAFGEIAHDNDELIDLLCEYMANGCKMKEEYVRRADDFFYYRDRNNCERIYNVMTQYQKEHVFKEN